MIKFYYLYCTTSLICRIQEFDFVSERTLLIYCLLGVSLFGILSNTSWLEAKYYIFI